MPPSKYGWAEGTWNAIHITAAWASTSEIFNFFCQWIRIMINNLPCVDCVKHGQEYIQNNPPEKADDPFIWAWEYHNAVNRMTKKPEIDYNTIKKMYLDGEIRICNSGCGEGEQKQGLNSEKGFTQIRDTYKTRYRPFNY